MSAPTRNPPDAGNGGPEAAKLIHDLRNRLNSLAMNAAVLAAQASDRERGRGFSEQIERDLGTCKELLVQLAERLAVAAEPGPGR